MNPFLSTRTTLERLGLYPEGCTTSLKSRARALPAIVKAGFLTMDPRGRENVWRTEEVARLEAMLREGAIAISATGKVEVLKPEEVKRIAA